MSSLGGKHTQARTGRVISYWSSYGPAGNCVFVAAVFTEGLRYLIDQDFELSLEPAEIPMPVRVRDALLRYIDCTEFGEALPLPPNWRPL